MVKKRKTTFDSMGEVRIIGGEYRGRKLPVITANGLRPTSDRVKETLFNWLQFEVPGARCLDVFSGSGALGFEALSRGAEEVVFLEKASEVANGLFQNIKTLASQSARVEQGDSLTILQKSPENPFDIVFVDPPFHQNLMQATLERLFENEWLAKENAWLYLEQEKTEAWPKLPEDWICYREKTTSQVRYGLFTPA